MVLASKKSMSSQQQNGPETANEIYGIEKDISASLAKVPAFTA
jgi:hypothetical protein